MKDVMIPIDQAGRVVLPKNVREELAIKPGDVLKVSIHGTAVTLTPIKETPGFVRKGKALVFSTMGDKALDVESVNELVQNAREAHSLEIASGFAKSKR